MSQYHAIIGIMELDNVRRASHDAMNFVILLNIIAKRKNLRKIAVGIGKFSVHILAKSEQEEITRE